MDSGSVEPYVRDTFAQVLGIDDVQQNEDFFKLGGDSLGAARIVTAVRRRFGVEVPLADFLDNPTAAWLVAQLIGGERRS